MRTALLLFAVCCSAFAAVSDLRVMGATSTQMVISAIVDDPSACTIEVSKASGYSPLATDVDPALLGSTADDCNRTGNVISGKQVIFVVGKQGGDSGFCTAADGSVRSCALQADAEYFIRVTQGSSAETSGRTATIPLGDSRGETLATSAPFTTAAVTANVAVLPDFPDPYTGALVKRVVPAYGYGGTTANNWSPGHSDCNKTLTGVLGSCWFTDAAGTGWTSDSGTLTDAVRGDDSNFANYSGTTQQPLYIRLGTGKSPTSSTSEEVGGLSFQNVILRALTSAGTEAIDLCLWEDVNDPNSKCISPPLQATLTTTEQTIRFCKDAPCSAADAAGDTMVDKPTAFIRMYPNTRVYNTAGDLFTWKFTGSAAQNTCDTMLVNQYLDAMDTRSFAIRTVYVTAKSCGSTPPQVTVSLDYDLTHNGTTGVTLFQRGNPNFGIRIRKLSTSGATVSIGYALWRAAVSTPFQFANGSGGFGKRCQIVPLASGEYLCHMGQHIVGIAYGAEGLTLKNYGFAFISSGGLGLSLASGQSKYSCMGDAASNDSTWSDTVPGRFFCVFSSQYDAAGVTNGHPVVVEFNLNTSAEKAVGDLSASGGPGLSNMARAISFTSTRIITPCVSPCSSGTDNYTLFGQFARYAPTWDGAVFNKTSVVSVQGNLIFLTVFSGSQDSHGWVFAMDLGNEQLIGSGYTGTYSNTQHVFAGFMMAESQACRWCALHTFQAPQEAGGAKYTVFETSTKCPMQVTGQTNLSTCNILSGTCAACPNVTLNGYNYNGKNWCGTLDITSSWNGAWGSTPSGWADGDPVAPSGCDNGATGVRYWGQKLQVGDYLFRADELVRILEKSGNTLTIVRGWGGYANSSTWGPKSHSNGDTWYARCGGYRPDPTVALDVYNVSAAAWWPILDPTGQDADYTYFDPYQNHALHTGTVALSPAYPIARFDLDSPSSLKSPSTSYLELPYKFAGVTNGIAEGQGSNCSGNGCEKHPSYGQTEGDTLSRSSFLDLHPRLSHGTNGNNAVALVAGKTFIYKWQGDTTISPRHFDLEVYTAFYPLMRVNTLTDSATDSGKWCWAVVANDCFSGSSANSLYFVNEAFDTTFVSTTETTCREAEFGAENGDICFGNTGGISNSISQWLLPIASQFWPNGSALRVIAKIFRGYREAATENVKTDPLGKTVFLRTQAQGYGGRYIWLPRFPLTSTVGVTFRSYPIKRSAVPPGTASMVVEFGYDKDFNCNRNRDGVCIAESATLNESTPYKFAHETITGLSCSSPSVGSPCIVTVPVLANRVLHYSVVYKNGGGTEIARETRRAVAVN